MLTSSYPGHTCCTLYDHSNFGGWSKRFCLGLSQNAVFDLRDYGINDDVGSLSCGYKVKYELCDNDRGSFCGNDDGSKGAGNVVIWDLEASGESATTLFMHKYDSVE